MADLPRPEDMSHAMLVAVLMHHGGGIDLPADAFDPDALGDEHGAHHAVQLAPLGDGNLRLSVRARPPGDDASIEIRP